jgi:hypothetical protein
MVKFVKKNWAQDSSLNLEELQLKTVVLTCLATMARPRSDVGRLRMMDIRFKFKEETELEGIFTNYMSENFQFKDSMLSNNMFLLQKNYL